ncbi:MAG: cytochrome C [Polyangiaceae bacterium]
MKDPAERLTLISVYMDGASEPLMHGVPPAPLKIDTRSLDDGEHVLRIEASDGQGVKGMKSIAFRVRNGPEISVRGLEQGAVVAGQLSLVLHAYSGANEESWKPELAEVPAPVPTWAWVVLISVLAWAMYYLVAYWNP